MKKQTSAFNYGPLIALGILLLVLGLWVWKNTDIFSRPFQTQMSQENVSGTNIPFVVTEKEAQAFGMFDLEQEMGEASMPTATKMESAGRGGGGYGGGGGFISVSPYGERINYEYEFSGELPELPEKVTVYKRNTNALSFPVQQLLENLDAFGLMDLQKFQEVELSNISLNEDREKGYSLNIDFVGQSVGIYQNYQKWPDPYRCDSGICPQPEQLREKDVPSDNTLIRLANNFIKEYRIPMQYFGEPRVQKYWEESTYVGSKPEFYPDYMTVIYPFLIDDKEVTDTYGNPRGASVGINIRLNAVTSANFSPLVLESSHYEVKSAENILSQAQEGGMQGFKYTNPDKTITIKLGEPEFRLVSFSRSIDDEMRPEEFYMPSLVFPVERNTMEKEQTYYLPMQNVIVPLVEKE